MHPFFGAIPVLLRVSYISLLYIPFWNEKKMRIIFPSSAILKYFFIQAVRSYRYWYYPFNLSKSVLSGTPNIRSVFVLISQEVIMLLLWMPSEWVYTVLFISYQSNEFASRCGFIRLLLLFHIKTMRHHSSFHHSACICCLGSITRNVFFCRTIKLHFHLILDLVIDENYACRLACAIFARNTGIIFAKEKAKAKTETETKTGTK